MASQAGTASGAGAAPLAADSFALAYALASSKKLAVARILARRCLACSSKDFGPWPGGPRGGPLGRGAVSSSMAGQKRCRERGFLAVRCSVVQPSTVTNPDWPGTIAP